MRWYHRKRDHLQLLKVAFVVSLVLVMAVKCFVAFPRAHMQFPAQPDIAGSAAVSRSHGKPHCYCTSSTYVIDNIPGNRYCPLE